MSFLLIVFPSVFIVVPANERERRVFFYPGPEEIDDYEDPTEITPDLEELVLMTMDKVVNSGHVFMLSSVHSELQTHGSDMWTKDYLVLP